MDLVDSFSRAPDGDTGVYHSRDQADAAEIDGFSPDRHTNQHLAGFGP